MGRSIRKRWIGRSFRGLTAKNGCENCAYTEAKNGSYGAAHEHLLLKWFSQTEHSHPSSAYLRAIQPAAVISALRQHDILKKPERISEFGPRRPEFDKPRILLDQL